MSSEVNLKVAAATDRLKPGLGVLLNDHVMAALLRVAFESRRGCGSRT